MPDARVACRIWRVGTAMARDAAGTGIDQAAFYRGCTRHPDPAARALLALRDQETSAASWVERRHLPPVPGRGMRLRRLVRGAPCPGWHPARLHRSDQRLRGISASSHRNPPAEFMDLRSGIRAEPAADRSRQTARGRPPAADRPRQTARGRPPAADRPRQTARGCQSIPSDPLRKRYKS